MSLPRKKLIIDTNILLLLVIGAVEEGRHIKNSNRLKTFDRNDYDDVMTIVGEYDEIHTTHYIATEISNLIDLKDPARKTAYEFMRLLFSKFKQIDSNIISDISSEKFLEYGITDSSLIKLASEYVIITNDKRLFGELFSSGGENIILFEMIKELANKIRLRQHSK